VLVDVPFKVFADDFSECLQQQQQQQQQQCIMRAGRTVML
jgi:hypothetical protein